MEVNVSAAELVLRQTSSLRVISHDGLGVWNPPQKFVSRTYILPAQVAGVVLRNLGLAVVEDDGTRLVRYQSVHFDTPDLTCFHRRTTGRRGSRLVRTRTQLDSGRCTLEVEWQTGRGETILKTIPHNRAEQSRITAEGRGRIAAHWTDPDTVARLEPVMSTLSRRAIFVDDAVDYHVALDLGMGFRRTRAWAEIPGRLAVLDVRSSGVITPADRVLRRSGFQPERFDEYCIGMALLNPDLAANRWNRTLRRHFGWEPVPV